MLNAIDNKHHGTEISKILNQLFYPKKIMDVFSKEIPRVKHFPPSIPYHLESVYMGALDFIEMTKYFIQTI